MNAFGYRWIEPVTVPRRRLQSALYAALVGLTMLSAGAGRARGAEIDRLLAAVNGQVITEGDLQVAVSLNPLIFPGERIKPASRREALDRLVDLELMRQELRNFSIVAENEASLNERIDMLRRSLAEAEAIPVLLERLGLREDELDSFLRLEVNIMDFVELRFHSFAGVSEAEIRKYYDDRLTPQLKERGLQLPPLSQVSSRIEEILKEEKINDVLGQWLKDVRHNSNIEYFSGESPEAGSGSEESPVSPENSRTGSTEKTP
jgi:hypothetical protein